MKSTSAASAAWRGVSFHTAPAAACGAMPIAPYRIHAVRYAHRACTSSEVFYGDRHDASHYYRNLEERIPFTTLHDLPGMYRGFDRIRELAGAPDLVVPGHDPLVLDRLTRVADGIVEL